MEYKTLSDYEHDPHLHWYLRTLISELQQSKGVHRIKIAKELEGYGFKVNEPLTRGNDDSNI